MAWGAIQVWCWVVGEGSDQAHLHLAIPGHQLYELAAPVDAHHAHILFYAWQLQQAPPGSCSLQEVS